MKRFLGVIMTVFLGVLGFVSCGTVQQETATETVEAATEQRAPAPDFTLKDIQSKDVKLSDFRGKVVLLNFWATWCGPCKIEMPWFVEFQRKYKDRGFSVIAISMDEEGPEVVRPFAEELQLNFPIVVGDEQIADDFGGVAALPTTFIIDKQGKIASTHQGLVSKGDYQDEIERLL